ncbi:uncharacterized protein LOC131892399 [Tigriopus californicus]|uniref:uncharacterized protein LOC131892399 n=1 Tax=Tigriopus californicus TaxID=6832 RepID=UPI0027DA2BBE|nr:uncharacterized protein LOC131892399 [Tigriopus californicus]
MAEALNWRVENQLDRYFSFKSCKSTKGLPGSYRVMNCNRKAKDITNDAKKSKKTFQCLAKVIFNQREVCCCHDHQSKKCSNAKLQVMVYGCLAHSHSLERRNIRLSKKVKDQAVELLTSGIRSDVVIEKYLSTNDQDLHSKPVTYRDVYRIKKTCNLGGYDEKASEVKNVMNLLGDVAFHGFNFGKQFTMSSTIPEEIQEKVAETSGYFLLTYASPEMLKRFRDHSTIISIDGTHGTNSAKFVLISVLVFDRRGEGSPVFQALVENENQIVFSVALRVLNSIAPDACENVKTVLSDTSHTFINSWKEIINPNVLWSVCHWHLEKNWAKKIKNSDMLKDIKSLRLMAELGPFTQRLLNIQSK